MSSIRYGNVAIFLIVSILLAACVDEKNRIKQGFSFGDWSVFSEDTPSGKKCWVTTKPTSKPNRFSTGDVKIVVYSTIELFKDENGLSIVSADASFNDEIGRLLIDGSSHPMLFEGTAGRTRYSASKILLGLKSPSANRIDVGGESFEFSSTGFSEAFSEATSRCAATEAEITDFRFEQRCKPGWGSPGLAIGACTSVIESGRYAGDDLAVAHNSRGFAYTELGKDSWALEDFNAALRIDPSNADAYSNRGAVFANLGEYRRAVQDFDAALKADPDHNVTYFYRASALCALGDFEASFVDRTEAFRRDGVLALEFYEHLRTKGVDTGAFNVEFGLASRNALRDWTVAGCPSVTPTHFHPNWHR